MDTSKHLKEISKTALEVQSNLDAIVFPSFASNFIPPTRLEVEVSKKAKTREHFTKHERCYHHGQYGPKWKGTGGDVDIVEEAMNEVLKDNTYIGFTFNEQKKSVYLLKWGDWKGIDDESIGCERRPIPKGLEKQKTSTKWEHHSLYIKNP